nr:MAG: hypothetical protein DIU55_07000 [Bacillota bacterium]
MQAVGARPWQRWIVAGLALLMVLLHYFRWLAGGREVGLDQIAGYFRLLSTMVVVTLLGAWHSRPTMLTGPVLRVARGFGWEAIPLAAAEVKPLKTGWHIRWDDGKAVRRLSLVTPPEFQEAVMRAAEQAKGAPAGQAPRTVREAMLAVPAMERSAAWGRVAVYLALLAVLPLLSMWLDHPGFLFGVPVLIGLQDRIFAGTTVVLSDRTLWFLGAQGPVYQIPLDRVRSVEPLGRSQVLLRVDDPRYPVLKLARQSEGVDALVQLRKALAGEPLFDPAPAVARSSPAASAGGDLQGEGERVSRLRCSLCGKPVPGNPEAGGIHICERCQHRARYEAQEAGHGLQGREPLPM